MKTCLFHWTTLMIRSILSFSQNCFPYYWFNGPLWYWEKHKTRLLFLGYGSPSNIPNLSLPKILSEQKFQSHYLWYCNGKYFTIDIILSMRKENHKEGRMNVCTLYVSYTLSHVIFIKPDEGNLFSLISF